MSFTTGKISATFGLVAPTPVTRPTGSGTGHALPAKASGSGSQRFSGAGSGHARIAKASGSGSNGLPLVWDSVNSLTLPGEVFTSGGGTWIDAAGVLHTAAANVARAYYDANGVRHRLVEGGAANMYPRSEPTVAQLTSPTAGVTDNAIFGALGYSNGVHVAGGTGVEEDVRIAVTPAASTTYTLSVYVIMDDGSAPKAGSTSDATADFNLFISNTGIDATACVVKRVAATTLYRVSATGAVGASPSPINGLRRTTSHTQRGFSVVGFQLETGPFATSYIKATGTSVSRSGESLYLPWAYGPRQMTLLANVVDLGTSQVGSARFLEITGATSVNPRFILDTTGTLGAVQVFHGNATTAVSAGLLGATLGASEKFRALLNANGSVQLGMAVNGAAEVVSATTAANPLAAQWAAINQRLWIGCPGGGAGAASGFAAFRSLKIAFDTALTMAQMEAFV